MRGPLVPSAPPRSSSQRAPSSRSGRCSKYIAAPSAPPGAPSPHTARFAKTCPSGGFGAAIAAERAAAARAAAEVHDSCDWDDDRCPGSPGGVDSMASTATSMSEFPSKRGMLQPQKLKKGMMELANRFNTSATSFASSIPRSLALSLTQRPASANSALARLEWQPQVTNHNWSTVPRNSGMLARIENLRKQCMQIHRGIQKNKFSIQMVRESYTKIGQNVPALPPLDGDAPLPHPRESMFTNKEEEDRTKGPSVSIEIEINFTQEHACDILGVEQDASNDDVKKAYHSLARFAHPDKGGQTEEFQRLGEAYTLLQNK